MYTKIFSAAFAVLFLAPVIAGAQTSTQCPAAFPVSMSMTSELSSTVASASVGFHVLLTNESADLIYNAALAVDVVRKDTGATVDRFIVPQRVTLLQNASGKADFVWRTPGGLPSGVYTVRATLEPENTPLAEMFAGALTPSAAGDITVKDGSLSGASVAAVTVNGQPYRPHTTVAISQGSTQVVAVSANGAGAPYKGTLRWRLYAPDATATAKPLNEQIQTVQLHPDTSTDLRYVLSDTAHDGYYLEGELTDGRTTHYIDILLGRSDTVFAWTKCIRTTGSESGSANTVAVVSVIAAVLALGILWEAAKRRRGA